MKAVNINGKECPSRLQAYDSSRKRTPSQSHRHTIAVTIREKEVTIQCHKHMTTVTMSETRT